MKMGDLHIVPLSRQAVALRRELHKLTGLCAGMLVATYITIEAPISGMSMNPARSFASAVPAMHLG